jgi:hypothetical protein
MKKTFVMAAVTAVLGAVVLAGPALAQNRTNTVTQSTAESVFYGFVPTAGNIQTFTQNANAVTCVGPATALNCSSTDYVKNTHMPGSYTDRPDSGGNSLRTVAAVVSAVPDFGCGVWNNILGGPVALNSGSECDESALNLHDRVNSNFDGTTTVGAGDAVNSGLGQNTAPSAINQCGGNAASGQNCGTLVGNMVSNVTIAHEVGEDGMPSGSITFSRTQAGLVSFSQDINQVVAGLYTFSEVDTTTASFQAIVPVAPVVAGGLCNEPATPSIVCNDNVGRTSGGTAAVSAAVAAGLPITATLDLVQEAMGGEPGHIGQDTIGYTVNFPGNGEYPNAGAFFTPGLNVADWANTPAVDTSGFPN